MPGVTHTGFLLGDAPTTLLLPLPAPPVLAPPLPLPVSHEKATMALDASFPGRGPGMDIVFCWLRAPQPRNKLRGGVESTAELSASKPDAEVKTSNLLLQISGFKEA
jgi:hypothetical protein